MSYPWCYIRPSALTTDDSADMEIPLADPTMMPVPSTPELLPSIVTSRQAPFDHIRAMNTACAANDVGRVRALRVRYPYKLHQKPQVQGLTYLDHPLFTAAKHGHIEIVKILGHSWWKLLSLSDPTGNPFDTPKGPCIRILSDGKVYHSVFGAIIRLCDPSMDMITTLRGCRGSKFVENCRFTAAGMMAILTTRYDIVDMMWRDGVFRRDKHVVYHRALYTACAACNPKMLYKLLGYPERETLTTRVINLCFHYLFHVLDPSDNAGDYQNTTRCTVVLRLHGFTVSVSRRDLIPSGSRSARVEPVTRNWGQLQIALACRDLLILRLAVGCDPINYTYAVRRICCRDAQTNPCLLGPNDTKLPNHPWGMMWSPTTHCRMSAGTRRAVLAFVLCMRRLWCRNEPSTLPGLPMEMILAVLSAGPV